jgi:hypothetical protein
MQSPFASSTLSFDWMEDVDRESKMSQMIQYVQFNSYLSSSPERTHSTPSRCYSDGEYEVRNKQHLKKQHMHFTNMGVLMVQDKKPFRVRFNKN